MAPLRQAALQGEDLGADRARVPSDVPIVGNAGERDLRRRPREAAAADAPHGVGDVEVEQQLHEARALDAAPPRGVLRPSVPNTLPQD